MLTHPFTIHSVFQGKLGSVRSLEDIAMNLTEHSGARINRLGEACLKNNLITASNGSLVSTGADLNHPPSGVVSSSNPAEEINSQLLKNWLIFYAGLSSVVFLQVLRTLK